MNDVDRWALVGSDDVVENVVLWNGDLNRWQPEEGLVPIFVGDRAVNIGDLYDPDTDEFTRPD